jgi:hypothetical protein
MTPPAIAPTAQGPGRQAPTGAKHELSPRRPLACNWIGDDHDVCDTIEARHHAQAQSRTPEWQEGSPTVDHFGP